MPLIIMAGTIIIMMPLLIPMMIPPVVTMVAMIAMILIISIAIHGYRMCPKFVLFFGQKRTRSC